MIINNKLDKSFGPVGSFAGIILFVAGVVLFWVSWSSTVNILLGAFLGFSYSSVEIDFDKKKVRFLNNLFGIIRTGKWMAIKPGMKIGIIKSRKTWRSFSAGNRTLDIPLEDYRLVLFNVSGKKMMPLKKLDDLTSAREEQEMMCLRLDVNKL